MQRLRGWCGRSVAFATTAFAGAVAFGAPPAGGPARAPAPGGPRAPSPGPSPRKAQADGARSGEPWAGAWAGSGPGGPWARVSAGEAGPRDGGERGREGLWRKPLGFAGLGVGAALLGAGVYSTLRLTDVDGQLSEPSVLAYRATVRAPHDPCGAARQGFVSPQAGAASPEQVRGLCAEASTFSTLQYAFYGAGALVGGLSALVLLATGGSREAAPAGSAVAKAAKPRPTKPSWRLQPMVGKSSATLTLHVRFF